MQKIKAESEMSETIIYKRPVCIGDEGRVVESVKHPGCFVFVEGVRRNGTFDGTTFGAPRAFESIDFRTSDRLPKPPREYRYLCSAKEAEARRIKEWEDTGEPWQPGDLAYVEGKWHTINREWFVIDTLICTRRPFVSPSLKAAEKLRQGELVYTQWWHAQQIEKATRATMKRQGDLEAKNLGLWPHCVGAWEATGKMVVQYGTHPGWEFMRNCNSLVLEGDEIKCGDRWMRALQVGQPMIANREYRRKVLA